MTKHKVQKTQVTTATISEPQPTKASSLGDEVIDIFKFIQTGSITTFPKIKTEGYSISEIMAEYQSLNVAILKMIDRLTNIFNTMTLNKDDISFLRNTDYQYFNRKINRTDAILLNTGVFKNLLEATLAEAIEKAKEFLGDDVEQWKTRVNKYITLAFKISTQNYSLLIYNLNHLTDNVRSIYNDLHHVENDFKYLFNFQDIYTEAIDYHENLEDRKKFVNKSIIECREFCLREKYIPINNDDKTEFIQNCEKFIELIDLQIKDNATFGPGSDKNEKTNSDSEQDVDHLELPATDITLNRQFLALYYLLHQADKEIFGRNKSEIARFIQLLTGKNYDNIYKLTKNPFKDPAERTSVKYQSDIQFIKSKFSKLGLNKIVQQIENDNLVG